MVTDASARPASRWKRFLANADEFGKAVEHDGVSYLHQYIVGLERRIAALEAPPGDLAVHLPPER